MPWEMVHRFLVSCSFICCTLIIASFAFFAVDQVSGASSQQVAQIAGSAAPTKSNSHPPALRRFVDGAAKDLTYPFHSLLKSTSTWANELLLVILGLTIYGVGLGYLARYSSGLS
jgi:hypothetical protein